MMLLKNNNWTYPDAVDWNQVGNGESLTKHTLLNTILNEDGSSTKTVAHVLQDGAGHFFVMEIDQQTKAANVL